MKKLLIILALAVTPLFGQQKEQALEILFKNVDSSYFDADGNRWFEITMPLRRAFEVMDLVEADTTCKECILIKGSKNYRRYVKENYPGRKTEKHVFGHLDAMINGHLVMMWMDKDYAFAMVTFLNIQEQ